MPAFCLFPWRQCLVWEQLALARKGLTFLVCGIKLCWWIFQQPQREDLVQTSAVLNRAIMRAPLIPLWGHHWSPWCDSRVQRSSRRAQSLRYQKRLRNFSLPFPSSKELSQLDWHVWNSVAPEQAVCQQHYTPHPKEHVTPLSLFFFPFAIPTLSLLFFLVDPCRWVRETCSSTACSFLPNPGAALPVLVGCQE